MPEQILLQLRASVTAHPWWQARAQLAKALLQNNGVQPPATVLDAGCGWGVNLTVLRKAGYAISGLDISKQALEMLAAETDAVPLIEADLTQAPPENAPQFSAVLALDVLEHIDDDRQAVAHLSKLVEPGGLLLISVPALPELFSDFDEVQGHRRRYVPEKLQAALNHDGLVTQRIVWWGAWMVPLLRARKVSHGKSPAEVYASYLKLPMWPGPLLLRAAFAWDHSRTLAGKSTTGTSLFAVVRKV